MSDPETLEVLESIPGGHALVVLLGRTLSFHDAEILALVLDRSGGSRLDVSIVSEYPRTTTIRFVLCDWIDANIRGFSHQNVVFGIKVRRAGSRHVDGWELGVGLVPGEHEIELEPTFGAFGTLRCTIEKIEILPSRPAK